MRRSEIIFSGKEEDLGALFRAELLSITPDRASLADELEAHRALVQAQHLRSLITFATSCHPKTQYTKFGAQRQS
jgi:hypothetical protein